jgi:hypothetical protein
MTHSARVTHSLILSTRNSDESIVREQFDPEQRAVLEALRIELTKEGIDIQRPKYLYDNRDRLTIYVQYHAPDNTKVPKYTHTIGVFFFGDTLHASATFAGDGDPVAGAPHIRRIIQELNRRMEKQWQRAQKQTKVRDLQKRSVKLQIEALAERMKFQYTMRPMKNKVVLVVKVDKQRSMYVDIPFSRIQECIDEVEQLIDNVHDLYERGIRFKVAQTKRGEFD